MELLAAALFAARLLWLPAGLLDTAGPDPRAPGRYRVSLETTAGRFEIQVERDLAPRGADRFYRLVRAGYYDDSAIFRVIPGYIAQFGIAGDPRVAQAWRFAYIPDDPQREKGERTDQSALFEGGNAYLRECFPALEYIFRASVKTEPR